MNVQHNSRYITRRLGHVSWLLLSDTHTQGHFKNVPCRHGILEYWCCMHALWYDVQYRLSLIHYFSGASEITESGLFEIFFHYLLKIISSSINKCANISFLQIDVVGTTWKTSENIINAFQIIIQVHLYDLYSTKILKYLIVTSKFKMICTKIYR